MLLPWEGAGVMTCEHGRLKGRWPMQNINVEAKKWIISEHVSGMALRYEGFPYLCRTNDKAHHI
jgi:hypothetical protein